VREISPELVLVDPELAQIERLRLAEDAVARSAAPIRMAPPPAAAPPRFTRATATVRGAAARTMPTLLLLSLLLNLLFAAALFAGDSNAPTLENTPPATNPSTVTKPPSRPPAPSTTVETAPHGTNAAPAGKPATHLFTPAAKADAERAVLSLVARRAANGNAPKALVDPTTGLLKNNVLAVCRPGKGGSFTCVVHPPQERPRGGLYVRYRPAAGGRPVRITWLGYRVSG
jgi:hypothetical protein